MKTQTNPQKQRQYLTALLKRVPKSEIQLQSKCAELLYFFYPDHWKRLVCVHNNSIRANTQGFGIVPGASDMYWLAPEGKTIYIEFKFGANITRPIESLQSDVQRQWQAICVDLGHVYRLCYNESVFWKLINFTQPCDADIDNLIWLK